MNNQEIYERFLDALVDRKIVIFGASLAAYKAVNNYLVNEKEHICYFCDNDPKKWGTVFLEIEICPPERLLQDKDNVVVLIASMFAEEITQQLIQMGFDESEIFSADLLVYKIKHSPYLHYSAHKHIVPDYLAPRYLSGAPYKSSIKLINENIDKINTVSGLFSDEKSKYVYKQIIRNRKYNYYDYSDIMEPFFNMYFVKGLFTYGENEVFVDGGVYNGITSKEFIKQTGNNYRMIYAFEPDEISFPRCEKALAGQISEGKLKLIKKGLYSENTTLSFNAIGDIRSAISEDGNTQIDVAKLDDEIEGRVTFIKMDIEAAEIEALKGAKRIITQNKPKLAISVYHKTEHLWDVPLLIKSMVPEYKLFLRHHTANPDETVLYATI